MRSIVLSGIRPYKESDRIILRAMFINGCPDINIAAHRFMKLPCVQGIRRFGEYKLMLVLRDGHKWYSISKVFHRMYEHYPFCQLSFRQWFAD